ncbi:Coiled-coil domain-containing protein 63 [Labeo rohita]|uniref:Coiled-coil domain-containing protein 63 n=1 Tax=Labeo rohita TaxID=84645 RepID=A0ABQ8MBN0_LABRO|nr:Coiled-coil domain-containing protein 63 [Labeo rohita]
MSETKAGYDSSVAGAEETEQQKVHRLRQELRRLERNRDLYLQEEETLRKQRQEIGELRAEQERLRQRRAERESPAIKAVGALLKQRDELDKAIEKEKQTQAELQKEITIMEKKLSEKRRGQASRNHKSQPRDIQKAIRTTQSKLDRSRARFNEQMKINSQLRKDIETLHMQRTQFQQLHRKLEKDIAEVIDKSATAYDAKVDAQTKASMIKEKAVKDLAQYSAEIQELERVIAHEHRLRDFMTTKNSQRATVDNGKRSRRRQKSDRCAPVAEMEEQKKKADGGEETPDSLKKAFQQIQELTGEDDLGMLVTKFIQGEERNFALFNYVNEQNAEAERLREEIQQIKKDTEQLNIKGRQREQESQTALKQAKDRLQECRAQTRQYEAQADHISKILDQVKTGIDSMFRNIDCDLGWMEGVLGSSSGITDGNLMTYLGVVEQKASELLTIQAFIRWKKADVQTLEAIVQPPVTRHDYEAEDASFVEEADRPLTREELRQHIMRKNEQQKDESLRTGASKDVKTPQSSSSTSSTSLEN